jgi:hypothetical protein
MAKFFSHGETPQMLTVCHGPFSAGCRQHWIARQSKHGRVYFNISLILLKASHLLASLWITQAHNLLAI